MRKMGKFAAFALVYCLLVTTASAQVKMPTETRNAALRYWMAFAELQDPPADKATQDLLEKTAAGDAPWDEARLGPILDKNEDAIRRLQRATKLPECDWGLEYSLGPRASIAYVPRARVLARLNTLYGMRLAAKGDSQAALDTWLAGTRFAQHLSKGGSLIFALIAETALLSNLGAISRAAQTGELQKKQREEAFAVIKSLPETAFDWASALQLEESSLELGAGQLRAAANPGEYYQGLTGRLAPPAFAVPDTADFTVFHRLMARVEEAFRLPPSDAAAEKLKVLQESVRALHPYFRDTTPSFLKINDQRMQILDARRRALSALGTK